MTGAGFGGSIVALMPEGDASSRAERVLRDYRTHHPARVGRAFATRASSGAGEIG
jgi:galactokinase